MIASGHDLRSLGLGQGQGQGPLSRPRTWIPRPRPRTNITAKMTCVSVHAQPWYVQKWRWKWWEGRNAWRRPWMTLNGHYNIQSVSKYICLVKPSTTCELLQQDMTNDHCCCEFSHSRTWPLTAVVSSASQTSASKKNIWNSCNACSEIDWKWVQSVQ